MTTNYIFVTGGVVSSLGKGIAAASLAAILEARGLNVTIMKLDPYINVDPGTMSPIQHGEVFVTEDGAETDLDLGHYERFIRTKMTRRNNFTTGRIYSDVLRKTNHTVLGYKGGLLYGVYCKAMTAQQVNAFCRDKLKLEYAVMLDGGHVAAIHGACNKINTQTRQFYAVRFL